MLDGIMHVSMERETMYAEKPQFDEIPTMTEAEYLAFADTQEYKYEYQAGKVYAMTGGSVRHGVISANMIIHLDNLIGERNCSVTSSDVRVHIASKKAYRYPDVTVFCGEPEYLEGCTDTITNPVLLVEVRSPSTGLTDSNVKLDEYTQIASLQTYVLVAQDQAKVEVYRRHEAGRWLYERVTGLDAVIDVSLADAELTLSLKKIYRRVQWDDTPEDDQSTEASEN